MVSLNRATIIGNLGADPEIRYLPNGTAVTNLSVATTKKWKDKETSELFERTEWHKVTVFRQLAEICCEYLTKGRQVYIEGELRTDRWTDSNGIDRYTTKIYADMILFLGSANNF